MLLVCPASLMSEYHRNKKSISLTAKNMLFFLCCHHIIKDSPSQHVKLLVFHLRR